MATPEHYRSEAARCRELAAKSTDADVTRRWMELALDYEQLAKQLVDKQYGAFARRPPGFGE
jgi:hypothetical protein